VLNSEAGEGAAGLVKSGIENIISEINPGIWPYRQYADAGDSEGLTI